MNLFYTRLNIRVIIEQAKGVLTQLGDVPMDVAFERRRRDAAATTPCSATSPAKLSPTATSPAASWRSGVT